MRRKRNKKIRFGNWGRPILQIRNWGQPRARRRLIYFFAHLGVAFSVAALVIVLAAGVVLTAMYARGLIENSILNMLVVDLGRINANFGAPTAPSMPPSPPVQTSSGSPTSTPLTPVSSSQPITDYQLPVTNSFPPNLLQSTFYFGFANSPWLDNGATTMYEDANESALVFPPDYSWMPESSIPNTTYQIQNTVPGITTKIVQENGAYKVLVFAPDGTPILTATSTPIVSSYPGEVGIGGTPSDFLVVYGGYKGAAALVRQTASGWSVQDVSMYFPYRVMHGGFTPVVSMLGSRTSSGSPTSKLWYVYSLTPNNPKLIKLFTDASGNIVGAVDFTSLLFPSGVQSATFNVGTSDVQVGHPMSATLFAKIVDTSGTTRYYQFTDNGFKTGGPYMAQSVSLNNYPWPVYGVKLTPDYGSLNGVTTQFFVSNDGTDWQPAPVGQEVVFNNKSGNKLLWKAVFSSSDGAASPFLGEVKLDFQVVRPQ